jgi:polysaccharide biosynthesis/export protein
MKRGAYIFLLIVLVALATARISRAQAPAADNAQSQSASAPAAAKLHDANYSIGIDDVLAINVWKEQELTRSVPVRSDGKISLPLVGELQAAGRTPAQLEQDVAEKLRNFITDPQVTVMVQQSNSQKINVLGQVVKPGAYPFTTASTVVDALASAGGLRDFAKKKGIIILRARPGGGQDRISFNYSDYLKGKNSTQNVKLEPGDTVVVP